MAGFYVPWTEILNFLTSHAHWFFVHFWTMSTIIGQMTIAIALLGFNDLGCSVSPTFLFRNRFYLQLSPHCQEPIQALRVNPFWGKVIYRNSFRPKFVEDVRISCRSEKKNGAGRLKLTNKFTPCSITAFLYMFYPFRCIFAGKPVLKIILHWKGLTQGYSTYGGSG